MSRRESDKSDGSDRSGASKPAYERGHLFVISGWILIVGGLAWVWMVFLTEQSEIGLWVAAVVCGLGYLLQRTGNQSR